VTEEGRLLEHAKLLFSSDKVDRDKANDYLETRKVRTADEALGLLDLLRDAPTKFDLWADSACGQVIGYLMKSEEDAVIEVMVQEGIAVLVDFARSREASSRAWSTALMFLARTGVPACVKLWVELFLEGEHDSYPHGLFSFGLEPRHAKLLFPALLKGLDDPDRRRVILFIANSAVSSGRMKKHPLSDRLDVLEAMIRAGLDPLTRESDGPLACQALGLMKGGEPKALLAAALTSALPEIQLEAAIGLHRMGDKRGRVFLRNWLDAPYTRLWTRQMLMERDVEFEEPPDSPPERRAIETFCEDEIFSSSWRVPPHRVEVLDRRTLVWPPSAAEREVFLLRSWTINGHGDEMRGLGMVLDGECRSVHQDMFERPVEDVYAHTCAYGLSRDGILIDDTVFRGHDYDSLLAQWKGRRPDQARMLSVAEIPARLNYGRPLVGIAEARIGGREGWLLLDGDRGQWIAYDEMPENTSSATVLLIHIGSRLLGFSGTTHRQPSRPAATLSDEALVERWRGWERDGLSRTGRRRLQAFTSMYSPFWTGLREHAETLARLNRGAEIVPTLRLLESEWAADPRDHSLSLGVAAEICGQDDLALRYLERAYLTDITWHRGDEAHRLARFWCARGRKAEAKDLLLACMRGSMKEYRASQYGGDMRTHEREYKAHRGVFVELLGDAHLPPEDFPADFSTLAS
jgi:hypothetical protein